MADGKSVAPLVLVFEDELLLREMMETILTDLGVGFRSFQHPLVELAEPHDCKAPGAPCYGVSGIISDVHMPVIDGLTFYEHLAQSDCRLKDSMLVLMSANNHRKEVSSSPHLQSVHYLAKPFKVKDLQDILKQCLAF